MTGQVGYFQNQGVSFLSSSPPPRSFTCAIFRAVFVSCSAFFALNRTETLATQANKNGAMDGQTWRRLKRIAIVGFETLLA